MKIREALFQVVSDLSYCRKCEFWDRDGHYCFKKNISITQSSTQCEKVIKILQILTANLNE